MKWTSASRDNLHHSLRPLTLSYRNQAVEDEFLRSYFKANLSHHRACHVLGILFYWSVGVIDLMLAQDAIGELFAVRGVVSLVFLAGFAATYLVGPRYKSFWQLTSSIYVVATGVGFIFITALYPAPYAYSQFVGVVFCMVFCYTFIRLRFAYATIAGTITTAAYATAAMTVLDLPSGVLALQVPLLVAINALGMVVAYHLEHSERRAFSSAKLLRAQNAAVRATNDGLEREVKRRTADLQAHVERLQRANDERDRMNEQLLQAQKMEAVGHLAGGIAHDFNNLLTVMHGFTDLALNVIDDDTLAHRYLTLTRDAAKRAEGLTRQLLAFSRKQVMQPRVVCVTAQLEGMRELLRRLIGEHIELAFNLDAASGHIKIDPAQFEQIIMNLAINAADAMPDGGTLTIESDGVYMDESQVRLNDLPAAGAYASMTFSDTGCGMDDRTLAQIFDPFFTTKEQGRGTGLGLSTTHGIIKQSGGHIRAESEPGAGTTFRIYLPAVKDESELIQTEPPSDNQLTGYETILVVEDEEALRSLVSRLLRMRGYTILEAENGERAMQIVNRHGPIDLLITDVVMPGMTGPRLASEFVSIHTTSPVLFMSGYSKDLARIAGEFSGRVRLIQKPFSPDDLARAVRSALDVPQGAALAH